VEAEVTKTKTISATPADYRRAGSVGIDSMVADADGLPIRRRFAGQYA
jgi:hypothetical protein